MTVTVGAGARGVPAALLVARPGPPAGVCARAAASLTAAPQVLLAGAPLPALRLSLNGVIRSADGTSDVNAAVRAAAPPARARPQPALRACTAPRRTSPWQSPSRG
jgi:hypothetical protein